MTPEGEKEVRDRVRRIETRLVKMAEAAGVDINVHRPFYQNGVVSVPSTGISIRDCLAVVPRGWQGPITFTHEGRVICEMTLPAAA